MHVLVVLGAFKFQLDIKIVTFQFVDLTSSRNVFIIGVSMYTGLVVPLWAGPILSDPDKVKRNFIRF